MSNVETLIKKVFVDFTATRPKNVSYSAQKIVDGQTFILTYLADEDVKNPIRSLPSFKELQEFIKFNDIENPLNIE